MMYIKYMLGRMVLIVGILIISTIIVSSVISAIFNMSLRDSLGATLTVEVFLLFLIAYALLTRTSERMDIYHAYSNPFIPKEVRENLMKMYRKNRDTGIFIFILAIILLLILLLLTQF